MKNFIIAILILSALTAYFSYCGENVPFERTQKEGWAFFGGDIESPIPKAGKDGEMEALIIEAPQEAQAEQITTAQAQQKSPITVSVEYPKAEKGVDWEMFFIGVAAGAFLAELAMAGVFAILYLRDKYKRRNLYEKCKNRP